MLPWSYHGLITLHKQLYETDHVTLSTDSSPMRNRTCLIVSPKFENFGDIMFLVVPPPLSPPPPHVNANACTGHNFVTNTSIKLIFAIAIEVPDYKNSMIVGINRENKMASGGHFCIQMLKKLVASQTLS